MAKRRTKRGGQGEIAALADPHHERAGFKLLGRAVRERWPIPDARRQRILTVLQQIVETDTFEVEKSEVEGGPNGEGTLETKSGTLKMPNHRNQVAAAKVLLAAAKLDQDDRHHVEGLIVRDRHHAEQLAKGKEDAKPAEVASGASVLKALLESVPKELRAEVIVSVRAQMRSLMGGVAPEA